MENVSG